MTSKLRTIRTNTIVYGNLSIFLSIILLLFFILVGSNAHAEDNSTLQNLRQTGKAFAEIAKNISPSVVNIQVEQEVQNNQKRGLSFDYPGHRNPFSDDFFKYFFDPPFQKEHPSNKQVVIGQGSGFIINCLLYTSDAADE